VRAGLLSQPQVIQRINETFVSTSITYPELAKMVKAGDEFAGKVAAHWFSPVTLIFLTTEGRFITRLSPLAELCEVHPDTSPRPGQMKDPESHLQNTKVFLKHLDEHFGATTTTTRRP
jgi:hypothetical protein